VPDGYNFDRAVLLSCCVVLCCAVQVKRVAAQGPISSSAAAVTAPDGYNFDRASGYFFNVDTGLYWDSKSGAYYNSSEQKWYSWDAAAGQYKELAS
jgi:hypothetical protein